MINLCQFKAQSSQKNQRLHFESGSLTTLIRLVEQGSGFTIVPYLALETVPQGNCVTRPFADPQPVREISLIVRRSYVKHNILEALRKEVLANLPQQLIDYQKHKSRLIEFQWN